MKNNKLKQLLESRIMVSLILFGAGYSIVIDIILSIIFMLDNSLRVGYVNHIREDASNKLQILSIVISICIAAPIIEELLYRALIMKIAKRFLSFKWANILQAVIFAISHFNFIQMAYAFIIGLTMGYIYNKHDTVYSTIPIHMSFNIVGYFLPLLYNNLISANIDNIVIIRIIRILIYCLGLIMFIKSAKKIMKHNFNKLVL